MAPGATMAETTRPAPLTLPPLGASVWMTVAYASLQEVVDDAVSRCPAPRVLEAGCGSTTRVRLPARAVLTGIDLSPVQLERNTHLHQKIHGDLQRHDFGTQRFDLIICWDVLEHVPDPEAAMRTMLSALADDGLLLIAVPNVWSVKGIVTRLTPFAVHAWFYRNIIGDRRVGREHSDQFPTVLSPAMAPQRMLRQAAAHGCEPVYFVLYESLVQRTVRERSRLANLGFSLLGRLAALLTRGRSTLLQSDAMLVLRRPAR